MKTKFETPVGPGYSCELNVLASESQFLLQQIQIWNSAHDYRFSGESDLNGLSEALENLSWSQRRHLRNAIRRTHHKITFASANRFLHRLFRKVLQRDTPFHLDFSEREAKIRTARKAWVEARDAALKALELYKSEKGDYFRTRGF